MHNSTAISEKMFAFLLSLTYSYHLSSRFLPKRNETLCSNKNLYVNVCSSFIHMPQTGNIPGVSALEGMDGLWYSRTLEEEPAVDSCDNRKALKCFLVMWKKPDTKRNILCESIYVTSRTKLKCRGENKPVGGCQGLGRWGCAEGQLGGNAGERELVIGVTPKLIHQPRWTPPRSCKVSAQGKVG